MAEDNKELEKEEKQALIAETFFEDEYVVNVGAIGLSNNSENSQTYGILTPRDDGIVSSYPSKVAYDEIHRHLLENNGVVTKELLMQRAAGVLQHYSQFRTVENALKYAGAKNIDEKYDGKYVHQLSKKEAKTLIGAQLATVVETAVSRNLSNIRAQRAGGLEEMFGKKEEDSE